MERNIIDKALNYILKTPENTNPAVLRGLLANIAPKDYIVSHYLTSYDGKTLNFKQCSALINNFQIPWGSYSSKQAKKICDYNPDIENIISVVGGVSGSIYLPEDNQPIISTFKNELIKVDNENILYRTINYDVNDDLNNLSIIIVKNSTSINNVEIPSGIYGAYCVGSSGAGGICGATFLCKRK